MCDFPEAKIFCKRPYCRVLESHWTWKFAVIPHCINCIWYVVLPGPPKVCSNNTAQIHYLPDHSNILELSSFLFSRKYHRIVKSYLMEIAAPPTKDVHEGRSTHFRAHSNDKLLYIATLDESCCRSSSVTNKCLWSSFSRMSVAWCILCLRHGNGWGSSDTTKVSESSFPQIFALLQ